MRSNTSFDGQYIKLIRGCIHAAPEKDRRTGHHFRSIGSATIDFSGLPLMTLRDIGIKFSIAEIVWHMNGSNSDLLERFGYTVWSKFPRRMAYGSYWRDGYNFLSGIARKLTEDPTSKGCVLDMWPKCLRSHNPCIVAVHFTVVRGALEMAVLQRSADMYLGFPHDVASFSILWHLMAEKIGVPTRNCNWTLGSAHLYDNQIKNAGRLVTEFNARSPGHTPNFSLQVSAKNFDDALAGKEYLVHDLYRQLQPRYDRMKGEKLPSVEIVG